MKTNTIKSINTYNEMAMLKTSVRKATKAKLTTHNMSAHITMNYAMLIYQTLQNVLLIKLQIKKKQ